MKKIKICVLMACLIMCVSSLTFASNFYDVKGTKYEGVVDRVASLGIINGVSESTFAPNKSVTRAELAKMIVFTRGLQDYAETSGLKAGFSDTKGHWAESYIAAAEDLGFLNGYTDGTFRPDAEVSYAEVIAIILRGLGYVNIDETSGTTWYSGYIKRMFEIDLGRGVDVSTSYEAAAKRGEVAILWWNMLISNKWAVSSEWEVSGLYYTYSNQTQMEVLFPDYVLVKGRVNNIFNPDSGDTIGVQINGKEYKTKSDVPIYAKGAMAVGVYDKENKSMRGFTIDEELEDFKIVSGPIFYLEDQGYKLGKSKNEAVYGLKSKASYAYLLVSKENGTILRSVLIDASNSNYVEKVEVTTKKVNPDDKESDEEKISIYLNGSEDPWIDNAEHAILIKNGKKVEWESIEEGSIITELIPGELYTFEKNIFSGKITDYSNLKEELYIDNDKYFIAENCFYVKMGTVVSEEDDSLKVFTYSANMNKAELEPLLSRDIQVYLNMAEEICFIKFGKYLPSNLVEKYDNLDDKFFYLTSLTYRSGDELMNIGGTSLTGKPLRYSVPYSEDFSVGDFVIVSSIEGKHAESIELINSDIMYEEDDISILVDYEGELYNNAFGEYILVDDTVIFKVNKYYENNSANKIDTCILTELSSIYQVQDLEKYKIHLFCNNDMEIDIVFLERELNRTNYPVGRVMEIKNVQNADDDSKDKNVIVIPIQHAKIATIGGKSEIYEILSGDCEVGELITYDAGEDVPEKMSRIKIKERFQMKFLGYEKDVVIESFDKELKCAKVKNNSEYLDLLDSTFSFNNKEIDLMEYKYILSEVKKDSTTGDWKFITGKFYAKEDLVLKPGDRIAFGELNGIAVVYRGWTE